MLAKKLLGAAKSAVVDAYYNLVTLLLPGNGTNGAQNNTFLDSSTNNFTITRNGNTTQGTFSPFSQTGWGNYFDGSGDYLYTNSNVSIGTSVFTIELWVYVPDGTTDKVFFSLNGGTTDRFTLGVLSSTLVFRYNGVSDVSSGQSLPSNQWNHVAVVREGTGSNQTKLYLNGVSVGTGTVPTNYATDAINIGTGRTRGSNDFSGYISNARLVIGTALYTSNFTPSTTPLTAVSGTSLLACQSNRFVDNSTSAYTFTVTGSPSVQAFSPFAPTAAYDAATVGGSGYFDGTGDYLSITNDAEFKPGSSTNPFSIECWLYPTSTPAENRAVYGNFKVISYPSNCDGFDMLYATNRTLVLRWGYPTYTDSGGSAAMNLNTWNHLVICRNSSGSMSGFLNGSRWFNTSTNTGITDSTAASFWIGWAGDLSGSTIPPFPGYIAGFSMLKGTTAYDPTQTTLTVPTAPPTNVTDTSLLLNFTNAGITDATAKNDLETVGNAQISTTQSKFGGSSMYFDGTGDWLIGRGSDLYNFGSGDFTIEFWMNSTQTAARTMVAYSDSGGASNTNWGVFINLPTADKVGFYASDGSTYQVSGAVSTTSINDGNWHFITITRSGSTFRLFVDGVIEDTETWSGAISSTVRSIRVGDNGGSTPYEGYIDDLRITKGYARYTANFTAPTAPFALQ
jgi:hypothetical protein